MVHVTVVDFAAPALVGQLVVGRVNWEAEFALSARATWFVVKVVGCDAVAHAHEWG